MKTLGSIQPRRVIYVPAMYTLIKNCVETSRKHSGTHFNVLRQFYVAMSYVSNLQYVKLINKLALEWLQILRTSTLALIIHFMLVSLTNLFSRKCNVH